MKKIYLGVLVTILSVLSYANAAVSTSCSSLPVCNGNRIQSLDDVKFRHNIGYSWEDMAYNTGGESFILTGQFYASAFNPSWIGGSNVVVPIGTTLASGIPIISFNGSLNYDSDGSSFTYCIVTQGSYQGSSGVVTHCEEQTISVSKCGDGNTDNSFVGYMGKGGWQFEQCDEGSANSNTTPGACKLDCSGLVPTTPAYSCPAIQKNKGDSCDDGNSNTINDRVGDDCICRGTLTPPTCTSNFGWNVNLPTIPRCDDIGNNKVRITLGFVGANGEFKLNNQWISVGSSYNFEIDRSQLSNGVFHTIGREKSGCTEYPGDVVCPGVSSCVPITEICGNGIDEDCNGSDLECTCTPDNSNAVNVCSDTTFINNCGTTVYGTKSCVNPDDKPVRQCTANGWIKTDKRWNWANYAPNGHYQIGNEASLNEGETPSSTTCGEGANDKPVRQCTANGWIKTDKRWNWANYDQSRGYQLNDEASLNEGETPSSLTCGPVSYTQMRLTKTASTDIVNSGDLVTYTITMYNDGPGVITNSRISDILPAGMIFVSSNRGHHVTDMRNNKSALNDSGWRRMARFTGATSLSDFWWKNDGEVGGGYPWQTVYVPSDQLTWFWGDIPAGQNRSFTVTARYNGSQDGQCMINTAFGGMDTPEYPRDASNDSASATVCTTTTTDLQIVKSVNRPTFPNQAGEEIIWTLDYKNNGPATAARPVIVDILPAGISYNDSLNPNSTFSSIVVEAISGGRQQITWTFAQNMAAGVQGSISFKTAYQGGKSDNVDLTNVVSIATVTDETTYTNNNSSAKTKPYSNPNIVDVQILKSVDKPTFVNNTGEIITWTLNYKNNGPATATGVVIVDILPKELTYLLGSVDGAVYTFAAQATGGKTQLTWILKQPLAAGATGSLVVRSQYKGGAADGYRIINPVAITATNDSNPNNNNSAAETVPYSTTTPQADVQITKTVDKPTFPNTTGEIITWTLNYKNNGPSAASNVVVRDLLPQGLSFVSSIPVGSIVTPDPRIAAPCVLGQVNRHCQSSYLSWNIGTLQPGQTGQIVVVSVYSGGVVNTTKLTNNTDISTTTKETNYNNNTGSAVTTPFGSGLASLGDYVWIDANKDGIQNSGEVALAGVKVELYKPTSCTADLGTPIATTTTNGSGYYLFTGLQAGNYKVKFILPNGYEFTTPNQGSDDALDSDAGLNGVTSCIELKEGENNMTVDVGVILEQLISCEGLTLSATSVSVGANITYNCVHKNATQAIFTVTLSGSSTGIVYMTGFTGQFTIPAVGVYNAQCTLDNGITYKVATFTATGSGISCAYKKHLTNADVCAVKSALDPFVSPQLNLSGLIYVPTPYPYCTTAQIADTNYQCVDAPAGSQIVTRDDMACMKQLTVASSGGGGGGGGGGTYRYCGDGRIDSPNTNGIREECDGNDTATQICTNQCVYTPKGTPTPTPINPAKPKPRDISLPSCESIDPPSVNKGEYLPFWWELESDNAVNFVSDCSNAVAGKTNVLKGGNQSNDPLCHFRMYVDDTSKTPAAEFSKYCYKDQELLDETLFTSFFATRSESLKGYTRSQSDGGSAFFGPSSWSEVPNLYGEYKLSLDGSTFYVCEEVDNEDGGKTWKQSEQRYEAKNAGGYTTECSFNFTVTTPYFVQKGKSLGTLDISQGVIDKFFSFDTKGSIVKNIVQISNYQRTSNLTYLGQQFANKYTQLAKPVVGNVNFNKVPGKEIYVKVGNGDLPIAGGDLPRGTIISNGGDIIIRGSVKGQVMMIANNGTIYFESVNNNEVQIVEGIYIADHVKSLNQVFNKDLSKGWANKGGLRIKGMVVSKDPTDIEQIYGSRRSHLENWFKTNVAGSDYKKDAILNGAALTIETDPSFWTNLPPGANELMSALQTYK